MRTMRRTLNVALVLATCAWGPVGCGTELSTDPVLSKPGTTTTIILVRHAERNEGLDPPLNPEGRQRVLALTEVIAQNGVTAIYCPDLLRNRETCSPIAEALGLEVNLVGALQLADTKALANWFVDRALEAHAGGVVLWVGNTGPVIADQSGNLQEIYARLGGTGSPPIRYQDLYVAVIPEEGDVRFIKAEYGGESSLD